MLVALNVLKTKKFVIVHPVMVMHDRCFRSERCKDLVIKHARQILMLMGGIVRNCFISIKTHTGSFRLYHDHSVIPVKECPCNQYPFQVRHKFLKIPRGPFIQLADKAFTWTHQPVRHTTDQHTRLINRYISGSHHRKGQCLYTASILILFFQTFLNLQAYCRAAVHTTVNMVFMPAFHNFDLYIEFVF